MAITEESVRTHPCGCKVRFVTCEYPKGSEPYLMMIPTICAEHRRSMAEMLGRDFVGECQDLQRELTKPVKPSP
jgi:hypothetical protein